MATCTLYLCSYQLRNSLISNAHAFELLKFQLCYHVFVVVIVASNTSDGGRDDKYSPRNIKQVADTPRSLQVEVLSSKSKVSVTIDGTTVSSWPGYKVSSESGEGGMEMGEEG